MIENIIAKVTKDIAGATKETNRKMNAALSFSSFSFCLTVQTSLRGVSA